MARKERCNVIDKLDALHKAAGTMRGVASSLMCVANALADVGIAPHQVEELMECHKNLRESSAEVRAAASQWCSDAMRDAQRATGTMMGGVFAGMAVNAEGEDKKHFVKMAKGFAPAVADED